MKVHDQDSSHLLVLAAGMRAEYEDREREAQRKFNAVLASWASDLLILRSRGKRSPRWIGERRKAA